MMMMNTTSKRNNDGVYSEELEIDVREFPLFKLEKAVCNHGFFMMSPNCWIPSTKTLQRPLRLADSVKSVVVSIFQQPASQYSSLRVRVHATNHSLSSLDHQIILDQVRRMLRLSIKEEMSVQEFQNVHPEARKKGFGRIFRSPTLFEDAVKSLLLCRSTFQKTLNMVEALCKLQEKSSNSLKRKRATTGRAIGNFPTPQELVDFGVNILQKECKIGYRAEFVVKFAKMVASGKLKIFEDFGKVGTSEELYVKLKSIKGFGTFTCANVLMCIGFYDKIPQDSETRMILQKVHARQACNKKIDPAIVEEIYAVHAPYQCLAYWLDLLGYYESNVGTLSELPRSSYPMVAGCFLQHNMQ